MKMPTIMPMSVPTVSVSMLIVDDDLGVLNSMASVCKDLFACPRVYEAANGREALSLFFEHPDIGLILTDTYMPVMDGIQLVNGIRKLDLFLPIIITTGGLYLFNEELRELEEKDIHVRRLLKPYSSSELFECVRDLMNK
jgi:CheY-like chemotaxis protein